jgi:hypothetical protein
MEDLLMMHELILGSSYDAGFVFAMHSCMVVKSDFPMRTKFIELEHQNYGLSCKDGGLKQTPESGRG